MFKNNLLYNALIYFSIAIIILIVVNYIFPDFKNTVT